MAAFDNFPCCMMKFYVIFAPNSKLGTQSGTRTAKKLLTNQKTARSNTTDSSIN